jgi:hypothetical protein
MGKGSISRIIGTFIVFFLLVAVISAFIPTILRSVEPQVALLFLFIGGCLGYFFLYEWPKRKFMYPK